MSPHTDQQDGPHPADSHWTMVLFKALILKIFALLSGVSWCHSTRFLRNICCADLHCRHLPRWLPKRLVWRRLHEAALICRRMLKTAFWCIVDLTAVLCFENRGGGGPVASNPSQDRGIGVIWILYIKVGLWQCVQLFSTTRNGRHYDQEQRDLFPDLEWNYNNS